MKLNRTMKFIIIILKLKVIAYVYLYSVYNIFTNY